MDLIYLFRVLLRKKWLIISLALISSACAFVFVMFKKDMFESVAQYSTGFTAEKVKLTDGSTAVDIYTLDIKFNNVIETFKSPRVIGMLSYKLMVHDLENPQKPYKRLEPQEKNSEVFKSISTDTIVKVLKNKISSAELLSPADKTEHKILEYLKLYKYDYSSLKNSLIIRRVERTDYLEIIYQSENPELSAYVVNTLGAEFLNYYKNFNNLRNTETAESIQQLLNQQQRKVDSLTNELMLARMSQGALDPVKKTEIALETSKELQMPLSTAQSEYNLQSNLYDSYTTQLRTVNALLGNNGGDNAIALFKKRDDLREQIAKAPTPDPELTKQLNAVEAQIKQQSGTVSNRPKLQEERSDLQSKASDAKARRDAASATISQLNGQLARARGSSNISPKSQVEIDAINTQLEMENTALKTLKDKLGQAQGLIRDDPTVNFRQTLVGEPDIQPVPKRKILTTGLAGVSAFVIISLIFLLIEIFNNSIKTPSLFSKLIKLPLKGVLNTINLKKYQLDDLMLHDFEGAKFKKEILFKNNIRKLRYELDKTGKQVFLLTSTQNNVGKTLIIQSLAFGFLLSNKKVLLIDLNFENNALTRLFKKDQFVEDVGHEAEAEVETEHEYVEPVVSRSTFDGQYMLEEDVITRREIQPYRVESATTGTPYHNLYILGCKGGNHSPSEVISYKTFAHMINEMRNKFDYILIESAGLNNRSDSYELFQFADRVVTVFSAKQAPTQLDHKSIESIQNLGDKNFGAVLNQVEFENINL